jgi:GTP-binding protein Era
MTETRCGLVALVGRPNVGKSTLLNQLVGQKISITSRKPQTTRHRILGIVTEDQDQIVFVDTPGFHSGQDKAMNRLMNRTVHAVLGDVDLILFMIDRLHLLPEDELLLERCMAAGPPVFLVINKVDTLADREALLPFMADIAQRHAFAEFVPLSALKRQNTESLLKAIRARLPANPWLFDADQLTDRNARYLAAEFVREKITRQMGDEVPYEAAVEIEEFRQQGDICHISAVILVEKETQKRMLIGEGGSRLKLIGSEARKEMERLFDTRVMLKLWVKVKGGWSDDERALKSLGFDD